jgi:hypothetical protein
MLKRRVRLFALQKRTEECPESFSCFVIYLDPSKKPYADDI